MIRPIKKIGFFIALLVLIAGLVFYSYYKNGKSAEVLKLAGVETSADKDQNTKTSSKPAIFQPEAQMLSQALNVPSQPKDKTNQQAAADHPITAQAGTAPYEYKSSLCQTTADKHFTCLETYYQDLVKNYGVDIAFNDIKQRSNQDSYVLAQCHPIVHVIGQEASKSYKTVSEAYLHGDSYCWSGYYHGILEGFIGRIGRANLPSQLNMVCADIPGKETYNFNYYNCVHGIGHGLMETSQDEVFDSLHLCDNLTGSWEQLSCYSGVFMENIIADGKNHTTKYLKPDQPLYPCNVVEQKYKDQCYLGQTSYALQVTGFDFKKVFDLCSQVEMPLRNTCNQSMGRDAANQAHHDAVVTKNTCSLASDPNDRANCIIGAVKEIISYYHAIEQATDFCNILEDTDKTTCQQTADSYYRNF